MKIATLMSEGNNVVHTIGRCTKAISNGGFYTNIASNSNLNKRPCNTFLPMVNNNEIEYFLPDPSIETNIGSNSKSNNTLCNVNLQMVNSNKIQYFFQAQAERVTEKQALK